MPFISRLSHIYCIATTDDGDDSSDYSSIYGTPKLPRNLSVIPKNHPDPGKIILWQRPLKQLNISGMY